MLRVPVLWPSALTPAEEVAPIKDLYAHLTVLKFSVEAWDAALQLYRTSKNPPPQIPRAIADRWRWVACHECVLELYHLRARLEKIQSVRLRNCPSVRAMVDMQRIKSARKKLDEYFPISRICGTPLRTRARTKHILKFTRQTVSMRSLVSASPTNSALRTRARCVT